MSIGTKQSSESLAKDDSLETSKRPNWAVYFVTQPNMTTDPDFDSCCALQPLRPSFYNHNSHVFAPRKTH